MEHEIEITPDVQSAVDQLMRLDAVETATFARELETIKAKTYDIRYPEFKGRTFVPVSKEADPADTTVTYRQWDMFGAAKVIANYGDDLPSVDVSGKEFTAKIKELGASYSYTVNDVRVALKLGRSLDALRARAARRAIEAGIDDMIAFGLGEAGMNGLTNHPNVTTVTLPTGGWGTATTDQILADLNFMVQSIIVGTKQIFPPDTLVLDTLSFARLSQKVTGADYDRTVLKVFLDQNPYIKNIDQWVKLDNASPAGGAMIIMYKRDPEILDVEVPLEYEEQPVQARNLKFVKNCTAKCSGVQIRYPGSMLYATNM